MKKRTLLYGASGLGFALWAARQRMSLRTTTSMDASRDEVWAVLTDTDSYAQWNPLITEFAGLLRPGERVQFVLHTTGGQNIRLSPTVSQALAGYELRWQGGLRGLLHVNHAFLLSTTYGGQTVLHHTEDYQGALVPLLRPLLERQLLPAFQTFNQALKRRSENQEESS